MDAGNDHDQADEPIGDDAAAADLAALDQLIDHIRANLKEGGPPVDFAALHAYIDRDLSVGDTLEVQRRINTWKAWHNAYHETRTLLEGTGVLDQNS